MRVRSIHPLPPLDPAFDKSLGEVIEARCRELLATHERLHLLWSGGIDTTAVLAGFLRVATADDWRRKLSVHYCPRSRTEHPRFFERFVVPLPNHAPIEGHLRDFVDGSRVIVTGDAAAPLFGSAAGSKVPPGNPLDPPPAWRL